jgi:PERQ amino acid-rich with GYF domain-containing protein
LKRTTTGGLTSNGTPWVSSPNTTFSPIGGAFGSFALSPSVGSSDKRTGFGSVRGESRFKNLMKDTTEESDQTVREKASLNSLTRDNWRDVKDSRPKGLKDVFTTEPGPSGSAALQGAEDSTPPRLVGGLLSGIGVSMGPDPEIDDSRLLGNLSHQTPHRQDNQGETLSPTDTNPYQSPENEKTEPSENIGGVPGHHPALPGLGFDVGQDPLNPLAGLGNMPRSDAMNERSQTSSASLFGADPYRGLAPLPGLGSSATWNTSLPTAGTPTRDRPQGAFGNAFGDSIFSPMETSSSAGHFHSSSFGPSNILGGLGRGGRLGMLANQAVDRSQSQALHLSGDTVVDALSAQELGGLGYNAFSNVPPPSALSRENESPLHYSRGFDNRQPASLNAPPNLSNTQTFTSAGTPMGSHPALAGPGAIGLQRPAQANDRPSSGGNMAQPPVPQVRTMVMPDRMKWEYKDLDGRTQGPFSGLEMHDWYKAGYFTPELQIRKIEDPDFEPLAQLIRKIGNSREPFLVPQIGVPHEPPPNQRAWGTAAPGGIQPPFANAFPSFGTTLTAEQQNDLERRKQESQYLMARQKEFLSQNPRPGQQPIAGQPHGAFPSQLHHQASSQSLHSQPSFGNMSNAFGPNSQLPMPPGQQLGGIMENAFRGQVAPQAPIAGQMNLLNSTRDAELPGLMDRMNLGRLEASGDSASGPLGFTADSESINHVQQVTHMLNDRARLQMEAAEAVARSGPMQNNAAAKLAAERLQQFHELREEQDGGRETDTNDMAGGQPHSLISEPRQEQSITQQVQAAMSAKASQPSTWQRVDVSTMHPIVPPSQSSSPMPAPVAQRKQNVADKLTTAGSPSPSHTPVIETPTSSSIAPWAKEAPEMPKASLKEIQEAEAKKAAKAEEIAAAARRAQLEKDIVAAQQAASAAQTQPGLPSSSTWASSPTATSNNSGSVWSKAGSTVRNNIQAPAVPAKKTLQQIQKEEEARKQRLAAATANANTTASSSAMLSSGKRYADLASKIGPSSNSTPATTAGGAWTTVGASGKAKPVGLAAVGAAPGLVTRSVSGSVATMVNSTAAQQQTRPKQAVRSTTLGGAVAQQSLGRANNADLIDEVKRWAIRELSNHLNKGLNGKA